jgi:catechol 2,3-dioxygenase-like lactoylglutathione lyase family enzyme
VSDLRLISATPVLASLDIRRSTEFFASKLGFNPLYSEQGVYGIVGLGPVRVHFWACSNPEIAEATGCRIQIEGIDALYLRCCEYLIVHPNAPLTTKPWGSREFAILDPDRNLITFHEEPSV